MLGLNNSTENADHAENPNADHSTAEQPDASVSEVLSDLTKSSSHASKLS